MLEAFKRVFPIYLAVHLAFFVITCLAVLFTIKDFAWSSVPLHTLWQSWFRWDAGQYTDIAIHGYSTLESTAFFPLYPLLISGMIVLLRDPLLAGMLISNIAGLLALMVLYQLVSEDFDDVRAERTVLYLSIFPTAFFLAAIYNEALFLCLTLLSFYQLRHGRWWLAGLFGLLASLTRSAGIILLVPFAYEYLRQHDFRVAKLHLDVLSLLLMPTGTGLFALYCYWRFGDPLAFAHAQVFWQRALHFPWDGIITSLKTIRHSSGLLSFYALRNLTDLMPDLLILMAILLSFIGPWRFPRSHWSYCLYAATLFVFFHLYPNGGTGFFPLESVSRFMLEIFPAFIGLAALGKYRMFHYSCVCLSGVVLFFLLTQYLANHWVV